MSLSSALSTALTGLTVSARLASITSSNIANAMTPGYVRRGADLVSTGQGTPGVRLVSVTRDLDLHLLGEQRQATAGQAGAEARASFLADVEAALGIPGEPGALTARVDALDTALMAAASRPKSDMRLAAVANAAQGLASHLNQASGNIQDARMQAEERISAQVSQLNATLERIGKLNSSIRVGTAAGQDVSGFMDQRQQQIDTLAGIVPIRQVERDNGMVALYTRNGATLLEDTASRFSFTPKAAIEPWMTQENGALAGLTLNGQPISTGSDSLIGGGDLAAQFAIRDDLAVSAQTGLDGLARDLLGRFSASGIDASVSAGEPTLFTDAGSTFLGDETGLAARIGVNTAVDGAAWRLRDGFGASAPGDEGDGSLLTRLRDALVVPAPSASPALPANNRSFGERVATFMSASATARLTADEDVTFSTAHASALSAEMQAAGVDTDQEMQQLLLIEQSYSANARVMQVIDGLFARLMEI